MTVDLLGMELQSAKNLLVALGYAYTIFFYSASKPLTDTDSVKVIRQNQKDGIVELVVSAFKTQIKM